MPIDNTFSENSWGNFFYKIYKTYRNYGDAKARCEFDGAGFLAIPRSQAENDFLISLLPNQEFWIGIDDIEEEGNFVAVDGREITWTNWETGQPNGGASENAVSVSRWNGRWNDEAVGTSYSWVCSSYIEGINFSTRIVSAVFVTTEAWVTHFKKLIMKTLL